MNRPARALLLLALLLGLAAGLARPAHAQSIKIDPASVTWILNGAFAQDPPVIADEPNSSTKHTLSHFAPINAAEFPFSVTTAGAYSIDVEYATPNEAPPPTIVLDVRQVGSNQHVATPDIALASTGGWAAYTTLTGVASVPLAAGDYILRVQNVAGTRYPLAEGHGIGSSAGANIGSVTFNRTGSLPAMGTLSGTVTSDLGIPVASAWVMANAPSTAPNEPGPFWYNGFWTLTDEAGHYSFQAPTGSYTVSAGRPDSFEVAGAATTSAVNVGSGTTNVPSLSLTARRNGDGYQVESEYYFRKNLDDPANAPTGLSLLGQASASNGYKLGWNDPGNWVELNVDVPASGWYQVTDYYFNGNDGAGAHRFTSDRGSSTELSLPSTSSAPGVGDGWNLQGQAVSTKPIYLYKGHNVIHQELTSGSGDFDAFTVAPTANVPALPARVETESFVNRGGGSGASPTGGSSGVVVAGSSGIGKDGEDVSGGALVGFWSSYGQSSWETAGAFDSPEYLEFTLDAPQDGFYSVVERGGADVGGGSAPENPRIWNLTNGAIIDEPFTLTAAMSNGWGAADLNRLPLPNKVPLKAGPNRIRVYMFGNLNSDYFEFSDPTALTGLGTVSGTVTASGQPVPWAQVASTAAFTGSPTTPVALGTRAITDAMGRYSILLPTGAQTLQVDALGLSAAPVSVTVAASTTQDISLTTSSKYEGEWWTNAWQDPGPNGHGLSAMDVAGASQGQAVGYLDSNSNYANDREFVEYSVTAPTTGAYTILFHYNTDAVTPSTGIPVKVGVDTTGAAITTTVPKADAFADYTVPVGVPLKAGPNVVRFTNMLASKGAFNLDYFTVTGTGQGLASLGGAVSAADDQSAVKGAAVTVSSGSTVVAEAITDGAGNYKVSVAPGTYTVTAAAPGFKTVSQTITLTAGQSLTTNFSLERGHITGMVKDKDGNAMANTDVLIVDATGFTIVATTDATGKLDSMASLGPNKVLVDAPLSLTNPSVVNIAATTTQDFVVEPFTGGTPVALPWNQDFFTTNAETADGTKYHSVSGPFSLPAEDTPGFPAASYPFATTVKGLNTLIPDPTGNANNVLDLVPPDNTIAMPANLGNYTGMVLIGTTDSGTFSGPMTLTYTDGTTEGFRFYQPDWFGGTGTDPLGPRSADNAYEFVRFSHRHLYTDPNGDGGYQFRMYTQVVPLNPAKTLQSITLPPDLDLSGTNPFLWGITMVKPAALPFAQARLALRIVAGLDAAPTDTAAFAALNKANTGTSATVIDMPDVVVLMKLGL